MNGRFEKGNVPWNKGKQFPYKSRLPRSEETRMKISEALRGKNNPNYGKHLSEETRMKISEAHKGMHYTEEIRRKRLGRASWNKGRVNCYSTETLRKMSDARRGKYPTEETREKLSARKGEKNHFYGKHHTEESKRKISAVHKGKYVTEETRRKAAEATIRAIKRGCYNIRPTAPEAKFAQICSKYNLPYKYVGDGKFWIENMNPDFVEVNGKKVAIEILGNYWHDEAEFEERGRKFAGYGWRVIGVWESELDELPEEEIVRKVVEGVHT